MYQLRIDGVLAMSVDVESIWVNYNTSVKLKKDKQITVALTIFLVAYLRAIDNLLERVKNKLKI